MKFSVVPRSLSGKVLLALVILDRVSTFVLLNLGIAVEFNPVVAGNLWFGLLGTGLLFWAAILVIDAHLPEAGNRWILKYSFTIGSVLYSCWYLGGSLWINLQPSVQESWRYTRDITG